MERVVIVSVVFSAAFFFLILYLLQNLLSAKTTIGRLYLQIENITQQKKEIEGDNVRARIIRDGMKREMNSLREFNERANTEIARLTGKRFDDCGYRKPEVIVSVSVDKSNESIIETRTLKINKVEAKRNETTSEAESEKKFEDAKRKLNQVEELVELIEGAEKVFAALSNWRIKDAKGNGK